MALTAKLQLRQSQSLVMTPQLMQSIRLLQLTHHELERFIDEEIERNPLIERQDSDEAGTEPGMFEADAGESHGEGDWFETSLNNNAETLAGQFDTTLENVFPDDPGGGDRLGPALSASWKSGAGAGPGPGATGTDGFDFEDVTAAAPSLRDHVREQLTLAFAGLTERLIAADLAEGLDECGYLRVDVTEVAGRLNVETGAVEAVLRICQACDPAGLFARDLSECLALQLERRQRLDPAMRALLDHLDLLARRDFAALRKLCGVDESDLIDMLTEIRALDPKPGSAFLHSGIETVLPDVVVSAAPHGGWAVELNPDALPRVLVDQTYFARVSREASSAEDREFVSQCMQNANWLTRSLDQRARTILKVTSEIVKQQDAFLAYGIGHMRPLNLRTVADAIGMHESTVSRVTANKYVLTPRGMFELRFFFTAAIASAEGGEAHSAEAVRHHIREMIAQENPAKVLSDDALVDILRKTGIDIARRTVAKYRESMSIPSSVQRRREKRAMAAAAP
ncbi:RNA polymerase factor sigma-54 [Nitratireductor sp. CAU 1489]|uniref:RNA polymerase sigma-54 factor n=1 Tax=Nitratireductor arenosus TaxID=2682096 RepID=A0A844QFN2_9HYPH|nr:RNA polymerase factor sigma-54 [Nitratireductor arenosus]MVA96888.1 RNA polymerase factor sigma-54 [Nitratireductor arenosus]